MAETALLDTQPEGTVQAVIEPGDAPPRAGVDVSQLHQGVLDGLDQTNALLAQYHQAYPWLQHVDWGSVQQALAQQPVAGVNVHPEVDRPKSPAWIQEQTIEPIPFGSLADPVSQAAFLMAPGLVRGTKAVLETAGSPGPSLTRGFLGERGNLGPVPRSAAGQPLPESVVRDEAGNLLKLHHGTNRVYPDFATEKFSSGAGGDLYGPGIYMTDNPQIAGDYATMGWHPEAKDALYSLQQLQSTKAYYMEQAGKARTLEEAMDHLKAAYTYDPLIEQADQRLQRWVTGYEHLYQDPANIRPVYADLKRPFDIDAPAEPALVKRLDELGWDYYQTPEGKPDIATNKELYQTLTRNMEGNKAEVNDWLAENGYDGITHIGGGMTGGQPHRVYIAFSPEQVYPAPNVEGLP